LLYNPTNGTILNTGTNVLSVIFTPSDTVDYGGVTNTVQLVVTPAPLTVSAGNASRAFGAVNPPLTGTIIGLTNGDAISANYTTTATSASPAGTYAIVPNLVDGGDRETNYSVILNNGTLTILPITPMVIWTNPVTIVYGTALSAKQLSATANVAGQYAYAPPLGTVLNTGTSTLRVTFTPNDGTDYIGASAATQIVVQPAPLTITAANATRSYGQPNPVGNGTITGTVNGDQITATYGSTANAASPVGTYAITANAVGPETGH
jgi:hypothetical protein